MAESKMETDEPSSSTKNASELDADQIKSQIQKADAQIKQVFVD